MTFIIVSYFVAWGFSELKAELGEDCNIYASLSSEVSNNDVADDLSDLDTVERLYVVSEKLVFTDNSVLTQEYRNTFAAGRYPTNIYVLNEKAFYEYAEECGIEDAEGKAIVINFTYDSEVGEVTVFNLEAGDSLEIFNSKELICECLIAGVTEQIPFGKKAVPYFDGLVVSEKMAEKLGLNGFDTTIACFRSSNTDKLQSALKELLDSKSGVYGENYVITNIDAQSRSTHSLFVLISIFAYGLITVIALIGVTNIINTLSTGMELRARDFATLRSVGMTKAQFEKMALLESIFTTVKALIFGIVIGTLGAFLIWWYGNSNFTGKIAFEPPVKAAVMCSVTVILLVYLIIRFSLARINKRNIIETIKNENL